MVVRFLKVGLIVFSQRGKFKACGRGNDVLGSLVVRGGMDDRHRSQGGGTSSELRHLAGWVLTS